MAAHVALLASGLMFRFVLPLVLMAATACRYNCFSLCYLVGLLALPLCPEPAKDSMRGRTGLLLKALGCCSLVFLVSHLVFHCSMLALKPSPSLNCSWVLVTWHIGLERVHDADWLNTLRIFLPDLAVFSACLGLLALVCRFLKNRRNHPLFLFLPPFPSCSPHCAGDLHADMNKNGRPQGDGQVRLAQAEDCEWDAEDQELLEEDEKEGETLGREVRWKKASGPWKTILGKMATVLMRVKAAVGDILNRGGQVVAAACLGMAGVYLPSLISTLYFATYLALGGWWACAQNFHRPALRLLNITFAIYSASHLLCLYLYQMWFFQSILPPDHIAARLLGLVAIFRPDYNKPWQLILNCPSPWPHFVGLVILLLLYFTLATLIRFSLAQRDALQNGAILRRDLSEEELMLEEFSAAARLRLIHAVTVDDMEGEGPSSMTSEKPAEMNVKENLQLGIERLLPGRLDRLTAHMSTAARFVMQQSYICALVTMMAWSITEPSWLTFVFLVWACLIWMLRDRRYHGMRSAPYLVIYASLLCTLHYIWNFNLDENELPPIHGVISNCERGARSTGSAGQSITPSTETGGRESCSNRCKFVMGILVLYTLVFWVLLRQHISECRVAKRSQLLKDSGLEPENTDSAEEQDSEVVQLIGNVLMSILSKYWIYVCGGMIFIVGFEGRLVVYKIIYMIIFLLCACVYQIFFEWWRHNLRSFWLVVISYTMVVLVSVYTFQFDGIDEIWTNMAHLTTTQLQDLGLERFSVGDLFTRIFIPTAFLLCCILQLHYFHERFLHLCDVTRIHRDKQSVVGRLACPEGSLPDVSFAGDGAHRTPGSLEQDMSEEKEDGEKDDYEEKEEIGEVKEIDEETPDEDKWALVFSRLGELSLSLLEALDKAQALVWRLLELHLFKVVVFTCFLVALQEVSLLNCVFVVCWTIALPYSNFRPYASSISTVWTSVIIVAKMVYQLKVVQPNMLQCLKVINSTGNHSRLITEPVDSANWWGLQQQSHDIPVNVFWYIKNHLLVLAVLLLEVMVTRRQTLCLSKLHEPPPAPGTLFQNIKQSSLDSGLLHCIKYFVNFIFYKFGLEVCFMLVVNVIGQRMDCVAVIHSLCLLVAVLCRRRRAIAALWPKYCRILAVLLLIQYFFCVGAPPTLCKEYPWGGGNLNFRLIKWLFLPDYLSPPNAMLLMNDFLLLLCSVLQQKVFKDEQQSEMQARAGSNDEQALDPHRDQSLNAHDHHYNTGHREISIRPTSLFIPNFLYCRSYLDMIKVGVFAHLFWLSLIVIFITGTTRVSATCILYFVACFYFLLFGGHLLLKPIHQLLRLWDYLITYTVLVITVRNILSVGACVYLKELGQRHCWFIQLFSLNCSVPGYKLEEENTGCELPHNEPGIAWDAVCLMFLLLQRRVFLSSYFSYIVADLRASTLLALRGAELFQASIIKAVKARMEAEQKSVHLLKKQMRKIKMGQEKIRRTKSQSWTQHQEKTETSTQSTGIQSQDGQEPDMHKRWWARWHGDHARMIHSGDYFLFESDDENEEEEEEVQKEAPIKGAVQFAYQAWVRSSRVALEEQRREEQHQKLEAAIKRVEKSQDAACRKAERGHSAFDSSDSDSLDRSSESDTSRHGAVLRRGVNLLRFAWALLAAFGDGLSLWLASLSREYMDISAVLQNERHCLAKEIHKSHCLRSKSLLDRNLSHDEDGQYDDSIGGRQSNSSLPPDISNIPCTDQCDRIRPPLHWSRNLDMDSLPDETGSMCSNSECTQETLVPSRQSTFDTDSELEEDKDRSDYKNEDEEVQSLEQSEQPSARRRMHHQTSLDPDTSESEEGKEERKEEVEEFQACDVNNETTADELLKRMPAIRELEESAKFYGSQPRVLRLLYSMYATLAARSEMLCYFVIILNHINTATALTLVLPVLIFLWAMLSIPRPSKHFWMTAIVYTEVVVVIKFLNQFPFIIWNTTKVARTLGVELKIEYANYDLAQLLVLFFHRSILKCNGLWDECKPISLSGPALEPTVTGPEDVQPEEEVKGGSPTVSRRSSGQPPKVHWPDTRSPGCSSPLYHLTPHSEDDEESERDDKEKRQKDVEEISPTSPVASEDEPPAGRWVNWRNRFVNLLRKAISFIIQLLFKVYRPIHQFFYNTVHPEYSTVTDVYVLMFLADVVDFIIIIFGYWAFGKHSVDTNITNTISKNRVPKAFLVMLLIQFSTMVIDRALYLRKTVMGKCIFQVVLVIGIHVWMFFILPGVTEIPFNKNIVAQVWYVSKCIYFGLSAYQIRCGYPTRILGNFLTKRYNYINLFLFQGFRLIPFLIELRAVMDWVWTDTTLSLSNWMCVEDIYANVFILKCWRESEKRYPQPKGQKKKKSVKYGMGGMIVFLLICIVWFPLLFMSYVRSVAGNTNIPIFATITISLGHYQPIFTAQSTNIKTLTQSEYNDLKEKFKPQNKENSLFRASRAEEKIEDFEHEDIANVSFNEHSIALWTVSPPNRAEMVRKMKNNTQISIFFSWKLQRNYSNLNDNHQEFASGGSLKVLNADSSVQRQLARLLTDPNSEPMSLDRAFPRYLHAMSDLQAAPAEEFNPKDDPEKHYINLSFQLNRANQTNSPEWWSVQEITHSSKKDLSIIVFNDKVAPEGLDFLSNYGITGLYVSVVLVIGKFVREFFSGISHSIMFEELPNVDRILKLCTDIFLVRETGELELEEELFAKLIFLYRSPETIIKWSREKTS